MNIKDIIASSITSKQLLLDDETLQSTLKEIIIHLEEKLTKRQQVFLCGNGGSAADALHIAAEFSGRFYLDRASLPVEALHVNMAAITSISNDYGYNMVFSRMLEGKARKGDVLWVFSTSGKSENIINVSKKAKELGVSLIAFTGETPSLIDNIADFNIKIPSKVTPRIQEAHMLLGHIISEIVEKNLFNE